MSKKRHNQYDPRTKLGYFESKWTVTLPIVMPDLLDYWEDRLTPSNMSTKINTFPRDGAGGVVG